MGRPDLGRDAVHRHPLQPCAGPGARFDSARQGAVRAIKGGLCAALLLFVHAAQPGAHDPPRTKVTWAGDIERLVHARCIRCHSPDGKGPMSLVTYEDARPYAGAMREEVLARRMPKWHAARGYGQFANNPSLSPFDIALIVSWVDGGALRGNPVKAGTPIPVRQVPADRHPEGHLTLPRRAAPGRAPAGDYSGDGRRRIGGVLGRAARRRARILAWVRDYEKEFPDTYWLETPLAPAARQPAAGRGAGGLPIRSTSAGAD